MHGFVSLLSHSPPDWFLLENSDELADNASHQESLDLFVHDLCAKSYDVRVFTANAKDYGLPQERNRTYIVGIMRPLRHFQLEDYTKFFDTLEMLIKAFMCDPIPLADMLLADDDPIVQRELQQHKGKPLVNQMSSKEMDDHRQAWSALGLRHLPGCTRVKKDDKDSEWFPNLALAKRTRLEIFQHKFQAKVTQQEVALANVPAKLSHGSNAASAADAQAGCMITDSMYEGFSLNRLGFSVSAP